MIQYYLSCHAHLCARGEHFVILDLRRDAYTLVTGETAAALRTLINAGAAGRTVKTDLSHDLHELMNKGVLTTNSATGRALAVTSIELASQPLLPPERSQAEVRVHHLFHFVVACIRARAALRWRRIERIVNAVARRKAKLSARSNVDIEAAREITAIFHRLRPFFPADHLCLYDSLALLEFLASYRIYPTWVFGVQLEPWSAHCWVQDRGFTFNEGTELAAKYTAIMTI